MENRTRMQLYPLARPPDKNIIRKLIRVVTTKPQEGLIRRGTRPTSDLPHYCLDCSLLKGRNAVPIRRRRSPLLRGIDQVADVPRFPDPPKAILVSSLSTPTESGCLSQLVKRL